MERPACLAILNLSCGNLNPILEDMAGGGVDCLEAARIVIQKSYEMTAIDGICCVIGTSDMDMDTGKMDMAGTRVVQDISPWHVCDEIIWDKTNPDTDSSSGGDPALIDFSDAPFSQIWVLSKQKPQQNAAPDRSWMLAGSGLPPHMIDKIADSVWHVPVRSQHPYRDPLPPELLIRLVLSYSKPRSLVLDPFVWHGATALVCMHFQRDFACITNNNENLEVCKSRLRAEEKERWERDDDA